MNSWPVCGCKLNFLLQASFGSVKVRLFLHIFDICGLVFLVVNEHIVFKLFHSFSLLNCLLQTLYVHYRKSYAAYAVSISTIIDDPE